MLAEVNAAYEAIFGDVSKLGLVLATGRGKFLVFGLILIVIYIVLFSFLMISVHKELKERNSKASFFSLDEFIMLGIPILLTSLMFLEIFINPTKEELIIKHPDYEEYVEGYVTPYLLTLPEEHKYEDLKIVEHPRGGVYLTYASVNGKSLEKVKQFDVRDLEFVLIEDNQSSYISERVLEDDLGGEFEAGYEKHFAYINETDRKIIEEHLGDEINIIKD